MFLSPPRSQGRLPMTGTGAELRPSDTLRGLQRVTRPRALPTPRCHKRTRGCDSTSLGASDLRSRPLAAHMEPEMNLTELWAES